MVAKLQFYSVVNNSIGLKNVDLPNFNDVCKEKINQKHYLCIQNNNKTYKKKQNDNKHEKVFSRNGGHHGARTDGMRGSRQFGV